MRNSVILLGYYGDDHRVCNSAWQSTGHELGIDDLESIPVGERSELLFIETMKIKKKHPRDLLMMLVKYGHETPFEKIILDFQLTTDIASHIHVIKHRIASVNAESARYKELEDKWYLPDDFPDDVAEEYWNFMSHAHELYHQFVEKLVPVVGRKRAKESARFVLPYGKQLNYDLMINLRSFANLVRLRADSAAQIEIQEIAKSMLRQVYDEHFCDWSLEALDLLRFLED